MWTPTDKLPMNSATQNIVLLDEPLFLVLSLFIHF